MNMNDARRGRGQKPDITLAHGVLIMDPEEEDGPYPKLHVVVCDADTGIILSAAKVTFLGVIAGKRGKKDASSGSVRTCADCVHSKTEYVVYRFATAIAL